MADKKIEVKGVVDKIVRTDGKVFASMSIRVPVAESIDIPLGAVVMSFQTVQSSMFGKDNKEPK